LNPEQRLALVYQSDVKRLILKRLRDEAMVSKSELAIWLKDQYKEGFIDIENVIESLVQQSLVKTASVKGIASDLLFLVEDFMVIRRPPVELVKNPSEHHLPEGLRSSYVTEVRNFFQAYKPDEKDGLKIIEEVLLNPANYEVLKLLREAMVTRAELEKLKKKGVEDVDAALKSMWENKLISVFQDDKGTEYYCLTSDVLVERYYPKYMVNNIRHLYKNRSQNPNALIKSLDLLKEEYVMMEKPKGVPIKGKKAAKGKAESKESKKPESAEPTVISE
jgi:hypothetical protein